MTPRPFSAPHIVVALDFETAETALAMADRLDPALCRLKVGKELFTSTGPSLVEALMQQGYGIFLDLKFHDIPHTVAKACQAATRLGVWMLNVHASGGSAMMQAARDGVEQALQPGQTRPLLTAVTVLTSQNAQTQQEIGIQRDLPSQVLHLATLAEQSGLDGVVCSALEVAMLRSAIGPDFCLVTPGIRPAGSPQNDQIRVLTPLEARTLGSDFLVIGRPITQSAEPLAVLTKIVQSLN